MYKNYSKIDKILSLAAKQYKLEPALHKYQASKHWESVLVGFFSEGSKGKTKVIDLKDGLLVVACLCRDLAYQIKLLAQKIIQALNELVGRKIVFAIKIEY